MKFKTLLVLFVVVVFGGIAAAGVSRADVEKLEELVDALKDAAEDVEEIEDLMEELEDLEERIDDALRDPRALSGRNYGDLAADIVMILPENVPLGSAVKTAMKPVSYVFGKIVEGAVDFSLTKIRRDFRRLVDTGMDPKRAARMTTMTEQAQQWLLWDWKQSKLDY